MAKFVDAAFANLRCLGGLKVFLVLTVDKRRSFFESWKRQFFSCGDVLT